MSERTITSASGTTAPDAPAPPIADSAAAVPAPPSVPAGRAPGEEGRHALLLLVLTFATGVVDAVSYLGLEGVFTANMTGNIVFVGLGALGHPEARLAHAGTAVLFFVLGGAAAGAAARRWGRGIATGVWDRVVTWLLVAAAATVAASAVLVATVAASHSGPVSYVLVALLSVGMAAQGIAARRLAVADLPTIVVTSTLLGLAGDGRRALRGPRARRLYAVLALATGALVGVALMQLHASVSLGLTVALLLAVTVLGVRWSRGSAPQHGAAPRVDRRPGGRS